MAVYEVDIGGEVLSITANSEEEAVEAANTVLDIREATAPDYNPTRGMSGTEKFAAGVGSSVTDLGRKLTNLALPESLTPDFATDASIAQQKRTDRDLMNTGAGLAGKVVGDIGAGVALGGGAAAALKAGTALPGALGSLAGVATSTPARTAIAEGAVTGAAMADPGQRLTGALTEGALGGGIAKGSQALGRALGVSPRPHSTVEAAGVGHKPKGYGMIPIGQEAHRLIQAGEELPLSLAADTATRSGSAAKTLYDDVLKAVPFVGNKLKHQGDEAVRRSRARLMHESLPPGANVRVDVDDVQGTIGRMQDYWRDEAFGDVRSIPYRGQGSWVEDIGLEEIAAGSNAGKREVKKFQSFLKNNVDDKGIVSGEDLFDYRMKVANSARRQPLEAENARQSMFGIVKAIDNMVGDQLPVEMVEDFNRVKNSYGKFLDLEAGVLRRGGKDAGEFYPRDVAEASKTRAPKPVAAAGEAPLQRIAQKEHEVIGDPHEVSNFWRSMALIGLFGGLGGGGAAAGGALGAVAAPVIAGGVAGAATSKVGQRALMGLTKPQRQMRAFNRANKNIIEPGGRALRRSLVGANSGSD